MSAVSTRYATALLVLVVLAVSPLALRTVRPTVDDDCGNPEQIADLGAIPGTREVEVHPRREERGFQVWTQGSIAFKRGDGYRLKAAALRSFEPIELYTRPPSFLMRHFEAEKREVEVVDVDGAPVTIHTVYNGSTRFASWAFVYDGRSVQNPVWEQVRTALPQVWNGTRPLTLLVVAGEVDPTRREAGRQRAVRWLTDAWRHHRRVCS